jgi:hypothetical protein
MYLSSSLSYSLNLSGFGDPTGSHATAGLALRVAGNYKSLQHGRVEIPTYNKTKELTSRVGTAF